jgi:hypothetical protein
MPAYSVGAYILALIGDAGLIFLAVHHVIAIDELKTDFKNPIDHCKLMNPLLMTEYGVHFVMTLIFLLGAEWLTVLINLPLLTYNAHTLYKAFTKSPASKPILSRLSAIYDPTNIMNSDQLSRATREGWVKLFFSLFAFFFYIYGLIHSLY